ncbi:hypothetical protein CI610_01285 [invertebrate metagenome]|uniref:Uncharacterized protein n=1 Tax=invertebrate metagenome TaxID=1711999 RepID=A0A2H9T975_9ZZZZ
MPKKNNDHKKNVLIAGCGDVGSTLGQQLAETGYFNVWGLRRNITLLPECIHPISWDFSQPLPNGIGPETVDYFIYSAAPNERTPAGYQLGYITGLQHCLDYLATNQQQPARAFLTSSTSVYHQNTGEWVNETSPTQPTSFRGKTILAAEQLLLNSGIPATVVRFGGIYRPGKNRLIDNIRSGKGSQDTSDTFSNRIHRDDCAGILAFLINRDNKKEQVDSLYLGVDCMPASLHDVQQWLALRLEITLDYSLPVMARGNKRCSNRKLLAQGYSFIYPNYREGYSALLDKQNQS